MKIKNKMQKGFTLIELMITVAIVGILAAVALPAYQDYTIKAQVSEAMMLSGGATVAITEGFVDTGVLGATNYAGASGKYVASIVVTPVTGAITITFRGSSPTNTAIQNQTIVMIPTANASGVLTWSCSTSTIPAKYRSVAC